MYFYINSVAMGEAIREARIARYGERFRSKLCRMMNDEPASQYKWDDSNLAKIEKGDAVIELDRLCELCMWLGIYPTEIIAKSTYL